MYDSLLYHFNVLKVGDTAIVSRAVVDSNSMIQPLPVNFLQSGNVQISPIMHLDNPNIFVITITLLILLGIISVVRYFLPDRLSLIFSMKSESQLQRSGESNAKVPGTLITGFFWLNFIISTGIFILLLLKMFFEKEIVDFSDYNLLSYIYLTILVLLLYRIVIIWGAAFVFQTQKLMKVQVTASRNIQFLTGVLLVPVILLMLYFDGNFITYTAIAVIVLLQLFRLVKIVIIGKSSTIFSALHIILYLCALEIVPVLVLMRLIGNGSVI